MSSRAQDGNQKAVLNLPTRPDTYWSTTNVGEAMPGALTPLGWTIWGPATERCARRTFIAMGALERGEAAEPSDPRDRFISIRYGRVVARVDFLTDMGDRLPGTSGAAIAQQFMGEVPTGFRSRPTRRRYPLVAAKLPVEFLRIKRRMVAEREKVANWWPNELQRTASLDLESARAQFALAIAQFERALCLQSRGMFIGVQPIYDQLLSLIDAAGAQHLTNAPMGGAGDHEETRVVTDLWALAHDRIDLDQFLARHGYHGPLEGEISGKVWREDPSPVLRLVHQYRSRSPAADPDVAAEQRARERVAAEQELISLLPRHRRPGARALLALAVRNVPMRGIGKVTFLQSLDVARAASRRVGILLADTGRLNEPEDIFYLTARELVGDLPEAVRDTVADRKRERDSYLELRLPTHWQGELDPAELAPSRDMRTVTDRIEGICGSGGTIEGVVRIVHDPSFEEVEPDEILVCAMTDPSWASIMFVSRALVVDIGGQLSHAAVVARELGIPCVMNTRIGTEVLSTGDRVRVDADRGVVEILERVTPAR